MTFLDTHRERAAVLLVLLGAALVWALAPFATGLIGIPVLYVIFKPVHERLKPHTGVRVSAALVVALALLVIVAIGVAITGLLVTQLQAVLTGLGEGRALGRLSGLRIMGQDVGSQLANAGSSILTWLGGNALGLVGTATRQALNLTIALFGFYYLLLRPVEIWSAFSGYLPFSPEITRQLQESFQQVTISTVIGEGLVAVIQGTLVGLAFWALGISNALFWAVVTVVLSILPIVGSALVWAPAVVSLAINGRVGPAAALTAWGILVVGNVDLVIRPLVFKRLAQIHPLITLVGAFAGVPFFGLLGLLIGPLALSYFFELLKAWRAEHDTEAFRAVRR